MTLEEAAELSDNIQSAFNFLLSLIFFVIYIEAFYCLNPNEPQKTNYQKTKSKTQSINPVIRRVSICYVLVYTIRYTFFIIIWGGFDNKEFEVLEYGVFDLGFVIGHSLFYLLMILRLQQGFATSSKYKLKKWELVVLYTLLALICVTNEMYFIIRHNRKKKGHIFYHDKDKNKYAIHTYLFLVLVILNFLLGGVLIYKFNKNIWDLVQIQHKNCSHENIEDKTKRMANISKTKSIKDLGEEMDKRFLKISVKYTLLCSICMMCTNLQFSGWILLQFDGIKDYESILWFDIWWNWSFDLVLFINFLCIWLSFPFSNDIYHKRCVCGYWHNKCENLCALIVGVKIYQTDKEEVNRHRRQTEDGGVSDSEYDGGIKLNVASSKT